MSHSFNIFSFQEQHNRRLFLRSTSPKLLHTYNMTECCSIRIKQLRECLERSLKPTTGTIVENAGDAGFTTTNKNKNNTIVHHHHQNQHQQHSSTNNRTLQILFKTCEAVVIKISSTSSSSQSSSSSSILNSAVCYVYYGFS